MHLKSFYDCFLKVTTSQNRVNLQTLHAWFTTGNLNETQGESSIYHWIWIRAGTGDRCHVCSGRRGRDRHIADGIEGPGDVSDSKQMKTIIDETVRQFGGIDIVVNSGGVRTNGSITEITEEDWDRTLDVNLKGAFIVSRLAIPEMKRRGGGVILHIAARSGMLGQSGRAAYCASKGGMVRLTEAMAMDHAKDHIRVNCICPGPTRTPMVDTSTPEKLARYKTRVPIGRIGEPEDVAYAALYLASDEASMVTAAILPVDGGMRLTGP